MEMPKVGPQKVCGLPGRGRGSRGVAALYPYIYNNFYFRVPLYRWAKILSGYVTILE